MGPNRPYLIRALYEWLVDNDQTPYFLVDATNDRVRVPARFVEDGRIVLNVAPGAVRDLLLGNDGISFSARFGGHAESIFVPPMAVLGVYSRENGEGMLFPDDEVNDAEDGAGPDPDPTEPTDPPPRGRPSLKVVK